MADRRRDQLTPVQPAAISWQGFSWGELLDGLKKDLQGLDSSNGDMSALSGTFPTPQWQTPTLINSWVAFTPVGYFKDPLGFVHLKGILTTGTSNTVAFVLPVGYRPGQTLQMPGGTGSTTVVASVSITTSGNVILVGNPAAGIGPDGLSFLAEN